jgi:hypothetical protein
MENPRIEIEKQKNKQRCRKIREERPTEAHLLLSPIG